MCTYTYIFISKHTHRTKSHDISILYDVVAQNTRYIGSVKLAFDTRLKYYNVVVAAETSLARKKVTLEKLIAANGRVDKIAVAKFEITEVCLDSCRLKNRWRKLLLG